MIVCGTLVGPRLFGGGTPENNSRFLMQVKIQLKQMNKELQIGHGQMRMNYDFQSLALKYPYLNEYLNDCRHYDFSHKGLCQLTKAILNEEFGIDAELRDDRLCPTIPSRLKYLSIVSTVLYDCGLENIKGLDIGTGAYAIYPILGFIKYGWEMTGTDIDVGSIRYSKDIISSNGLDHVKVIDVSNDPDQIFPKDELFTFTMSNPPFFSSRSEMFENSSFKEKLDRGEVIASDNELVTQDGEIGFVSKMIKKSKEHGDDIVWFSSLLGKKSSIDPVLDIIEEVECRNFFVKDYKLGNTKRWIVFWSFQLYRPKVTNDYKRIEPTIVEFKIDPEKGKQLLSELPLEFKEGNEIIVTTNGDVWSRAFRRKKQKPNIQDKSIFKITSSHIYWHYGPSSKIFQSFHTYIRKHI